MGLPFTTKHFLAIFERYNLAIWPLHLMAYAVGPVIAGALTTALLVRRDGRVSPTGRAAGMRPRTVLRSPATFGSDPASHL